MNYETNTFGIDVILTPTSLGEPFVQARNLSGFSINEEFIELMTQRETEADYFTSLYYDQSIRKNYTDIHQTCGIKELNIHTEDFIVMMKCEDESS